VRRRDPSRGRTLTARTGYIVGRPDHSYELISIVDPAEHRARRRLWEPAFVPDAVRSYLPFLHARWSQLAAQLDARVGAPLDLPRWLGFLAADFMGDFAYGSLFDFTLRGEDYLNVHEFGQAGTTALEVVSTVPWVRPLMLALPNPALDKWFATSMGVVEKRRREGGRIRDLAYYLVNPHARSLPLLDVAIPADE
jgi:cytochrome P450